MKELNLNSGMGRRMGTLTSDLPQCMTEISYKKTILSCQLITGKTRKGSISTTVTPEKTKEFILEIGMESLDHERNNSGN